MPVHFGERIGGTADVQRQTCQIHTTANQIQFPDAVAVTEH
jgi:hypothetical protein